MKLVLVGYGRMGKEVESVCSERGHEVILRVDPLDPKADAKKLDPSHLKQAEGIIEFALPTDILDNTELYTKAGVPAVIGTTGWGDRKDAVKSKVESRGSALLYGSNFSVGVHLFMNVVAQVAAMISTHPEFDIMVHEYHHKLKVDSPSGTALSIAAKILENLPRKTEIQTQALDRAIKDSELHVSSTRGGRIVGTHTVTIDSVSDSIEFTHTAHNRRGFATGAVLALEWLQGRKGFFSVDDFMNESLGLTPGSRS